MSKERFSAVLSAVRRWTGGRGLIVKMILIFACLHYALDYVTEQAFGVPEVVADPFGALVSLALVYWIYLRGIDSIRYPEGAIGKGPKAIPHPPAARSDGASVLLVDEDPRYLDDALATLCAAGFEPVHTLSDGADVLSFISGTKVGAVLLGVDLSESAGLQTVQEILKEYPQLPVIVMTGCLNVEAAVACMKAGAFDYLVKPVEKNRFLSCVRRALEMRELRREVSTLKEHLLSMPAAEELVFHGIVTRNRKMQAVCRYIESVAASRQPVLITGETGSGKELVARAVHDLSGCPGEFIPVNVAGLDDTMFSDALFGHRKGAYTGADQKRDGLLARASAGTLFLDEIGDMAESSQVKLLRLLEDRRYYPLGSDAPVETDARIVCATHHDVPRLVAGGTFRKDLFFRLQAHHVHIPPLRERIEDLPGLLDHWLGEVARTLGKKKPTPPPELLTILAAYSFPGNVRELISMIFDAVAQHRSGVLSLDTFRGAIRKNLPARTAPEDGREPTTGGSPFQPFERFPTLKEATDRLVALAMERSANNQGAAALMLGISREALNKRLARKRRLPETGRKGGMAA